MGSGSGMEAIQGPAGPRAMTADFSGEDMKPAKQDHELHHLYRTVPRSASALPLVVLVLALAAAGVVALPLWTALASGFIAAFAVGWISGFPFRKLVLAAFSGMKKVSRVAVLMALINVAIATWLGSGSIQSLVYYGLRAVRPGSLLAAGFLASTVVSVVLGTAVGTLSTVGVAAMAMARAAGVHQGLVAGALLSGALLGDRLSPVSPIFHVTVQSTGSAQERVWKRAAVTEGIGWILTLALYFVVQSSMKSSSASGGAQNSFLETMAGMWSPSPVACFPPLVVLFLAVFRVPVPWALTGGIIAGTGLGLVRGVRWPEIVWWWLKGFKASTEAASLDQAFSGGGLVRASNVVLLLLFAGAFNGVMESTGMFRGVAEPIVEKLRSRKAVLLGTMGLGAASACVMSNQLMSIIVPAELTRDIQTGLEIEPEVTAQILLASGGVLSPLIPWNIMGVMSSEALGLPTAAFAAFTFYPFVVLALTAIQAAFASPRSDSSCRKRRTDEIEEAEGKG
ncbi:MAG: hypothetical protein IMW97_02410 [Firmicutes bacterium]|nr:hypothetical protein [Candidatus Fermentithermobacillaceae bacterium]